MGEEGDGGGVGGYMTLGKVDVVVVSLAECGDRALEVVKAKRELFFVFAGFRGFKVEDQLLNLAHFEDTLALVHLEARRHVELPLGGAFADIP